MKYRMGKETKKHQDYLQFLENLDKINQTIQGTSDLQQMMCNVLDAVLSIFDCDRAFLLYPCDPDASSFRVPMERNKPEYPGAHDLKLEVPITPEVAEHSRILLKADGPVDFGPGSEYAVPASVAEQFNIKSFISMAIYPKSGGPWEFGIHQCSYERVWSKNEQQLFGAIGHRIGDGLSLLLSYQELLEHRSFLDNIVENIPNMIFVKDAQELRFVRFNKAGEELLGYSRHEMLGKNDYDFFTKKEADFFTAKDREVLGRKKLIDIPEETIKTRLKGKRILHTQKIPILNEAGHPVYLLGISQDITEYKHADDKLRQSEHSKKIQNQIADIFLTIPDEEMYGEVLAIVIRELSSKFGVFGFIETNGDLVVPSMTKEIWNECRMPEKSIVFPRNTWGDSLWGEAIREKKTLYSDGPIHIPEGHVHIDNFMAAPIVFGNKTIGLLTVANNERGYTEEDKDFLENITNYISPILHARLQRDRKEKERTRVEMELQQSNDMLQAIIEAAPTAIIGLDLDGKVQLVWNHAAERMLGWSAQEVMGQVLPTVSVENQEEFRRFRELVRTGKTLDGVDVRRQRRDGSPIDYSIYASPLHNAAGRISGNIAVLVDITERKKLEEQLRQTKKMEAVGQLAGGVAHDFNNMLGVMIGHAEMALRKASPDDPLREDLEEILAAGCRSTEITRQLLAFAREQTIIPKVLDLNETVEGLLKLLRRLIGEDIDLVWQPEANLWPIKMDPSQIDQILVNQCANARDAIAGVGKITIETQNTVFDDLFCAVHKEFCPGEYVLLAVSDNGSGMDKPTMDRIFEPFFTTKEIGQGTGLGLATVYGIVKQNNGFVNVYSEPGHGSTFKIYLPKHAVEAEQIRQESPATLIAQGSETVLVVEDESAVLNMVKLMLENCGYAVLTSSTPGEAIRIASENSEHINLLITDVVMPEMTGRDLVKNLNSLYPELKCLFMSGYTGNVIAHQGVLDEGVNFIQKPFSMQELAAKVREVLDSK